MMLRMQTSPLRDWLAIARYHIVLIAMAGTLTFGWLLTGHHPLAVTLFVGLDWFLINLLNRITDIAEDRKNGIPGTERVAAQQRGLTLLAGVLLVASFALSYALWPKLTPFRVLVQAIGLAYNYRVLPGRRRFKELYFFKNFASACLFILTCFVYPLVAAGTTPKLSTLAIVLLALFFLLFEHTYEILYDFRDLDGDRELGVPTYPVVHGARTSQRIVAVLLWLSALVIFAGVAAGVLGVREGLFIAAPLVQWLFYRRRLARGLTSRDCILLTHQGTALLSLFLVGTALWQRGGLPENIYLR